MAYLLDPGALIAAASGIALAALGLAVLPLRPRTAASVAFSAMALLWGGALVAGNLAQMSADVATGLPWVHLFVLLYIPLYLPVLVFATAHPWPGRFARSPAAVGVAALPAVILVLLYATAPGLFVQGASLTAQGFFLTVQGPLFPFVIIANSVLVFAAALVIAARRFLAATRETERSQLGLVTAALLAYVAYRAAEVVGSLFALDQLLGQVGTPGVAFRLLAQLACLGAAAAVTLRVARDRALPWRDLLLACGTVPLVVGVAEAFVQATGVFGFTTVGLWRLALVVIFAYALARHRLFDVELRLKTYAPVATYAVAALVGLAVLWGLFGADLAASPLLGVAATGGLLAACVPALRLGPAGLRRAAPQLEMPEYIYKRKIDVYKAALEEAEAKGAGEVTEQAFLTELRRGLGISAQEHRLLLMFLRSQQKFQAPPQAPRAKDGTERFRIERELGSGSFGRALLAHDTRLDRKVVLKQPLAPWVLEGEGRQLFLQEARLAARIQHPNVVAVHEVLLDADLPVLVLEYVEGGSLEALLDQERRLAPERAVAIARDVLTGLERIHKAGIVHRDVKPGNILLDAEGVAKVTDFGIARAPAGGEGKMLTVAAQGAQPGSLAFMSPEQARGEPVDARSDVFSLGVVLYRMLAGKHYIDLEQMPVLVLRQRVQEGAAPALGPLPEGLRAIVAKALAPDPQRRYPSAGAMAKDLEAWLRARASPPTARRRAA